MFTSVKSEEGKVAHSKEDGVCHICGKKGKMSFEHIPPHSVGNTQRSKAYSVVEIAEKTGSLNSTVREGIHYQQQQQGSGFATLCPECNSYLGRHYVNEYKDFFLATSDLFISEPFQYDATGIHLETDRANVLALFKHVISNFCTTTQPCTMLDCGEFLLNKESNDFPSRYKLYMYAVPDSNAGFITTGWMQLFTSLDFKSYYTVAYVALFPIGFALLDKDHSTTIPDGLGCDITTMSQRPWGERPQFAIDLPYMTLERAIPAPIRNDDGLGEI